MKSAVVADAASPDAAAADASASESAVAASESVTAPAASLPPVAPPAPAAANDATVALAADAKPPVAPARPLDDPALLAAAREIEALLIRERALDSTQALNAIGDASSFAATIDAFSLQSHHDPDARRMADLLREQMAVQAGEFGGRIDRLECGRSLCAAQYTFREAPRGFEFGGSAISIGERTPGGHVYRVIFSSDPRVDRVYMRERR